MTPDEVKSWGKYAGFGSDHPSTLGFYELEESHGLAVATCRRDDDSELQCIPISGDVSFDHDVSKYIIYYKGMYIYSLPGVARPDTPMVEIGTCARIS